MSEKPSLDQIRNLLRALDAAGPVPRSEKYSLIAAMLFASMVGAAMGAVLTWRVIEDQAAVMRDRPAIIELRTGQKETQQRPNKPRYSREDD